MINARQKMLLHIYKGAAALSEISYRNLLKGCAGVVSSADRAMDQAGFEKCMAALETVLFQRVHGGDVPNPIGRNRYILTEFYWREKLPGEARINSRQAYLIDMLWRQLQTKLSLHQRNLDYLGGIIRQATGKENPGQTALTAAEANCLIDALKDRLSYAIREYA